MKVSITVLFILILLAGCRNETKKDDISQDELNALFEREKKNEDRAKHSDKNVEIVTITDAGKVAELKAEIYAKKRKKEAKELAAKKLESFPEMYKTGDKTVVKYMIKILKGTDQHAKNEIYSGLQREYFDSTNFQITEPELIKLILEAIDNDDDEKSAMQLAGYNKIPGYIKKFEERLLSQKSTDKNRLFYWIGEDATSKASLSFIIREILASKINFEKDDYILSGLQSFIEKGTPEMRTDALNACYEIYNRKMIGADKFEEMKTSYSSANPANALCTILLKHGDQKVIPLANELLNKGIAQETALETLLRLEGKKHQGYVLKLLRDPKFYYRALEPTASLYRITGDKTLAKEILVQFEKMKQPEQYEIDRVANTIIEMGATEYFEKAESILKNKNLALALQKSYKLSTLTAREIADDIYKMGLVNKPIDDAFIDRVKEENEESYPVGATDLLSNLGIYMSFDAETGSLPADYDNLIIDFSKHCNGKLKDLLVWMDADGDPASEQIKYKITVIFNNKAYIAQPEDIGDWYDVEVVTGLLNKVLADSGAKEKFVFIETGDQSVAFVFAEETKVKLFAEKYKLY